MESKHTKGEWEVYKTYDEIDTSEFSVTSNEGKIAYCYNLEICCGFQERTEANAKLIADAGTTTNKCNLLPSELLERYNECIEALENMVDPISFLKKEAIKDGCVLDGSMAIQVTRNGIFYQELAKKMLEKLNLKQSIKTT